MPAAINPGQQAARVNLSIPVQLEAAIKVLCKHHTMTPQQYIRQALKIHALTELAEIMKRRDSSLEEKVEYSQVMIDFPPHGD